MAATEAATSVARPGFEATIVVGRAAPAAGHAVAGVGAGLVDLLGEALDRLLQLLGVEGCDQRAIRPGLEGEHRTKALVADREALLARGDGDVGGGQQGGPGGGGLGLGGGQVGLDRLGDRGDGRAAGVGGGEQRVDGGQGRVDVDGPAIDGRLGLEEGAALRQADAGIDRVARLVDGDDHQAEARQIAVVLRDRPHAGAPDEASHAVERLLGDRAAATDREGGIEHGVEVIVTGDGVVGQGDLLAVDGHRDLAVAERGQRGSQGRLGGRPVHARDRDAGDVHTGHRSALVGDGESGQEAGRQHGHEGDGDEEAQDAVPPTARWRGGLGLEGDAFSGHGRRILTGVRRYPGRWLRRSEAG